MLVPLSEPDSSPSHDIFRLCQIKIEENRKALEKRNRQMQETGPMRFYQEQLQKRRQRTDTMKKLQIASESTIHLAVQHSGAIQAQKSIYHQADIFSPKELIENAVRRHLTRYQRPAIGVFVSHFNFLYLQLFNLKLNVTILENMSLDPYTIICFS